MARTTKTSTSIATLPTPAERSREALTEAERVKAECAQTLVTAREYVEELRYRAGSDDGITGSNLASADAAVEVAELRFSGAVRSRQRAERALVNTETILADAVAPAVQQAVKVPVTVLTTRPTEAPVDLPAAYLVQPKASTADTIEGYVSGALDVVFYRTEVHREISAEAIESSADAQRIRLSARHHGSRDDGGVIVETVRLDVRIAYAPVPAIRRGANDGYRLSWFARGLASDVRDSMQLYDAPSAGIRYGSGDANTRLNTVNVTSGESSMLADDTDASGLRRRVAEVRVTAGPGHGCMWSPDQIRDKLVDAVEAQAGTCVGGLGRVSSAAVLSVEPVNRDGRTVKARFEFVSQAA